MPSKSPLTGAPCSAAEGDNNRPPPIEVLDTGRTSFEDLVNALEDEDEDDVNHQPLLGHGDGRRKAFEMEVSLNSRDEPLSCFEDLWRIIASILLAGCLLGPFVLSHFRNYHFLYVEHSGSWPYSILHATCMKDLDISFSQLYDEMKSNHTGFCDAPNKSNCHQCSNPVLPRDNAKWADLWEQGRKRNIGLVSSASDLDVLFLGDSITEHWLGTSMGQADNRYVGVAEAYQQLFGTTAGKYSAIPLGLSGDRCNQLLYRIQNGELPETLHPKVIWVLIGTNDFSDLCSRGSILAGNIAVLKEIMTRKPNTKVVINSILPVGSAPLVGGDEPNLRWMAYQWINTRLECLAATSENVFFFNGTSHFLTEDGQQINHTLMSDYLHPSKEGALLLGRGIVDMLNKLLV